MKLTLFTKENCHLCDVMKDMITSLSNEHTFEFEEVDITSSPQLFAKYKLKIPVLEIDGKMFAKFKVDEKKVREKLSRRDCFGKG